MKIPYDGKVSERLVAKRFKGIQFWRLDRGEGYGTKVIPCIIACDQDDRYCTEHVKVTYMDSDFRLKKLSNIVRWSEIYDSYFEANKIAKEENRLRKQFQFEPFLALGTIESHFEVFMDIQKRINEALSNFENFEGIDFCDVGANGIQIRGHHKEIKGYTYGDQPTIKYDFTNVDEAVKDFIEMWKKYDTPEEVNEKKRFIYFGEKYGWD